ncbi:MAG: AtpZ/AtpI family protein [Phycisphaerae bacterium]|jgi:F0F1-type ATP synthase assembly protein I|nr:AtpZ/AtpI family protein [Phycisphaerae bacterium]
MSKNHDRIVEKYLKYSGLGFELAGAVAIFCLIGYFVDQRWGTSPIGLITGAIIGIVGGMYLLIKEAYGMNKAFQEEDHDDENRATKSDDKQNGG